MYTITISDGTNSYEFETSREEIATVRSLLETAPVVVTDNDGSDTHQFAFQLYEALSAV